MGKKVYGMYLEDFEIGKVYTSGSRTITETDVVNYAGLSGDFNPLHMDDEFAKEGMFKERIAHGMLGAAISNGLSNQTRMFEGTTIAFLEQTIVYKSPLRINDTIHLEMEPTEIKVSSSDPSRGILNIMTRLVNQDNVVVIESPWVLMMKCRK